MPRREPDRVASEQALIEAALNVLERDGLLAGINLQEVADEARVNRGLIHHYFGTRRLLLRRALERGIERDRPEAARRRTLAPNEQGIRQFLDYARGDSAYPRLIALLAIDEDDALEPVIFAADRLDDLELEREAGGLLNDVDTLALLVAWDATLIGYSIIRTSACRQLGRDEHDLDARVLAILGRQIDALRPGGHVGQPTNIEE